MYNSYTFNQAGNIIVSDKKNMVLRENHEEIKKELTLENEIEVLTNKIKKNKKKLKYLGTHKENEESRTKTWDKIIGAGGGMVIFTEIILPLIFGNTLITSSLLFWLYSNALIVGMAIYIPISIIVFLVTQKCYNETKDEINAKKLLISELNLELEQKEKELQNIRENKMSMNITDTTIHELSPKETKRKVLEELKWKTQYIKKYKEYKKYDRQGILEEKMNKENLYEDRKQFIRRLVKNDIEQY